MKLEFELKPTDILLLKVLSCILMAVLTLNLFIFPGLLQRRTYYRGLPFERRLYCLHQRRTLQH